MIKLEHFQPEEFRLWWPKMSPVLLVKLDVFRYRIVKPVIISPNALSLGRNLGPMSKSDHNVNYWGEVNAADIFIEGVTTHDQAVKAVKIAKECGFTAIGVYPEWINGQGAAQVGFHLGVRPTKTMGKPATWGKIGGEYTSIEYALDMIEE